MLRSYPLGVMQGRLLPKYRDRYQAHPRGYWADEFELAATFGLELIEFILDLEDAEENPLLAPEGAEEVSRISARTGMQVRSVCADYFMEAPLHAESSIAARRSLDILSRLIARGRVLGVTDIVIPCVDQSALVGSDAADRLVAALGDVLPEAEAAAINLCLETDLAPRPFSALLDRLPSSRITVNYDTGNSAALGFDPREELAAYGDRVSNLHVKDRRRGGGSTELGTGDANIRLAFDLLARTSFRGPVIIQAFRDDDGVAVFRRQLEWLQAHVA